MAGHIRNPLGKLKNHDGYVRCFARGVDITDPGKVEFFILLSIYPI